MTSFMLIHSGRRLSTLYVGGADNFVISAKFTFRIRIQKVHVFKGSTSDQHSG